ncbi:MAG: response regulator [Desulfobacter sp.]|nr:MAG: response regulator [Desulfobacter sp.]
MISTTDLTQRKKTEEKLRQAQKMESIGILAGGIAHDFNNILSSIIGFSELALDGAEKGSELEEDLQEVCMAGMRAKELVKQILAFARQSDEEIKPTQVSIIAKEVLKFIKSSIPTTIQIKDNLNSDSFVMGSSTQIHQVLMNLCTNAAHAMEENGGILDLSLKDKMIDTMATVPDLRPGHYIEIKVSDTGMGIPLENTHTIFEPYFTTKAKGEGTGMGLAVVHGIVESCQGQIIVDSTLGKGTCFTIYLPVSQKRASSNHFETEQLPRGSERILFVDDEASIVKIGSKVLEQLGYVVTTRTNSLEALELFKEKPKAFDLVISDMTMPNLTGDKLAGELLNIRPDISVILCTGYSKKISEADAAKMGVKALAYKPIVKADLANTVRKVLDESTGYSSCGNEYI